MRERLWKNGIIANNFITMKTRRYHFAFAVILFGMTFPVYAQISKASFHPFVVEIKKQFYKNSVSGKHFYNFIDERDDTTRMGYLFGENKIFYFNFPQEATTYLNSKYNDDENKVEHDTILIGIQRLWISQEKTSSSLTKSILLSPVSTIGSCRVICNIYKKINSSYFLLHKYDSTITKKGYLGNTNDELMGKSLFTMIKVTDSISSLNISLNVLGEKLDFNRVKVLPKIITDEKMNEGFYLTYTDFLNNTPVSIPFEFKESKKGQYLKLLENKNDDSVYRTKSWGFCKNGVAYVRLENDFSQLRRYQNTFDLFITEPVNVKYNKLAKSFWAGFSVASTLSSPFPELAVLDIPVKKVSNIFLWTGIYKLDTGTGGIY